MLDTDFYTDVGDSVGLRVLDWAANHGLTKILAVGDDTTLSNGPLSIDCELRKDGLAVPVGSTHTPNIPSASGTHAYQANMLNACVSAGIMTGSETYSDAVTVYRTVLAHLPPGQLVEIVTVGFLNNIADLMNSPADAISPLTGQQLIAAKVGHLWAMAGQYPSGTEYNMSNTAVAIAAAHDVALNWPTPIIWQGFEVGATVLSGDSLLGQSATDVVARALVDTGYSVTGRASWDAMGVPLMLFGLGPAGYSSVRGSNAVDAVTGANTFTPNPTGRDLYVIKSLPDATYRNWLNRVENKLTW